MSDNDPIDFPEGEKVQLITLPVPADVMERLEICREYMEKTEGRKFDTVGEWLAWQLFDDNGEDSIKGVLMRERGIKS